MTTASVHVLVTGGAGYIGSVLCRQLLDRGYRVTVLDNFLYRQNSLLDCCASDAFRVVRGDCRDERIMTDLLRDADIIIPLAALVGAPLCDRDRIGAYTVNLEAVQMLCKLSSLNQQHHVSRHQQRVWDRTTGRSLHRRFSVTAHQPVWRDEGES